MRFCLLDGFLLYLRCVTEVVTSLNNPNPRCADCGTLLSLLHAAEECAISDMHNRRPVPHVGVGLDRDDD